MNERNLAMILLSVSVGVVFLAAYLLTAFVIMLCWNLIFPAYQISYWVAFAATVLLTIIRGFIIVGNCK